MQNRKVVSICGMLLTALFPTALNGNSLQGRWGAPFDFPLIPIHATLLPDGQIFTFGTDKDGNQGAQFEYSIWNFWAGWKAHTVFPNVFETDIFCSATELLPNGDVLVAGGDTRFPANKGIKDSFILSWQTREMQRTRDMNMARWYPTLTTLPNGEILVYGGVDGNFTPVPTPEIYGNGKWRSLFGAANSEVINGDEVKWFYPRNFVTPTGRIFGMTGDKMYFIDWQGNGAIEIAGKLPNRTRSHVSSAVMYRTGQILQLGGTIDGNWNAEGSRHAITIDINSGAPQVRNEADMGWRRMWPTTTLLANGEVLVTGGSPFYNTLEDAALTAEMWNPDTRQFRPLAAASLARLYHSMAILLPDASVLVGGGGAPGPLANTNGEIYWPPYLFDGFDWAPRPTIDGDVPSELAYGNSLNLAYGGAGPISRVTFVRNGAVTHSFNMGQRFLDLPFQDLGNGTLTTTMPTDPNIAPPGYYMIFLLNDKGVPSYARIVHLKDPNAAPPPAPLPPNPVALTEIAFGGTYQIRSQLSDKCLQFNGGSLSQFSCDGSDAQKFTLRNSEDGKIILSNSASNKCMEMGAASSTPKDGSKIVERACTGEANQSFDILTMEGNSRSFLLRFDQGQKCLALADGSRDEGQEVYQWTCDAGSKEQEFIFSL